MKSLTSAEILEKVSDSAVPKAGSGVLKLLILAILAGASKRVSACCIWRKSFIGGLLGRKKPCMRYLVLCAALASAYGIRSARSAPFYSSALLALAKQNFVKRWRNVCLETRMR